MVEYIIPLYIISYYKSIFNVQSVQIFSQRWKEKLLLINQHEAKYLREKVPNVVIRRLMKKDSKRHRYYVEGTKIVIKELDKFRNNQIGESNNG